MTTCSSCEQSLVEIDFSTRFVYLCLNWQCPKYRQPQGNREKTLAEQMRGEEKFKLVKPIPPSRLRPGYDAYLATKKINYRHLRDLGISSKEAANSTSKKRTKEIEKLARRKGRE
jgi:hypothetical protein